MCVLLYLKNIILNLPGFHKKALHMPVGHLISFEKRDKYFCQAHNNKNKKDITAFISM